MDKQPCVYIMSNRPNGVLYTGVTSDVIQRTWQHRNHSVDSFTKKYKLTRLVYYELHGDMYSAITREKVLKNWRRSWKIGLIEGLNPEWDDLFDQIIG
ncbi:MAG: GIY-YIG nuclease family protein [Proteobacteria bacterium]|nr:GIY-YIG nuclease family protein [Pseudomonadota bacterium]